MTKEEMRKVIDTGAGVVTEEAFPWLVFAGAFLLFATWAGFGFFWFLIVCAVVCLLIGLVTFLHGKRKLEAHVRSLGPVQPSPDELARMEFELMLATCHVQFTYYAGEHRKKNTKEGDQKAYTNEVLAKQIANVLGRHGTDIDTIVAKEHDRRVHGELKSNVIWDTPSTDNVRWQNP